MKDEIIFRVFSELDQGVINDIYSLESAIFDEPYSKEKIKLEAVSKNNLLVLIAYSGDRPIAYKAGFEMSFSLFFSWTGGVHPDFRGKGIAKELMLKQHSRVAELGYNRVRTNTENKYRDMLILNLRHGFNIVGTHLNKSGKGISIILEKELD